MAHPSVDWLSGAVRTLLKRVAKLEEPCSLCLDELLPFPTKPPGKFSEAAPSQVFSAETFNSEDVHIPDIFPQISRKTMHMPQDNDDEQYELDTRVLSAEVFDSEDVPLSDFLQIPENDGEQYEHGDVENHAIEEDTSDFSPHQFIAREDDGEQYEHGDVETHVMIANTSEFSTHQFNVDGEKYEYDDVETPVIDADATDFSSHQFNDDGEQCVHGDVDTYAIDASATCMPHDDTASPKTLDPSHVKMLIQIAKNISAETVHATVTAVATKLLEHIDNRITDLHEVMDVRMKDMKEFTQQTRHIQHATFCRRFGDDY